MDKREIEQILYDLHKDKSNDKVINLVIKSYNLGLQDAADNVALDSTEEYNERKGEYYREYFVDKESILKLKLIDGTSKK